MPPAVMTTLLEGLVSCSPHCEFTNVLDAPESNMACVIVSSIALALSCLNTQSAFWRLSHRAQRLESFDMGLGPESATERASSFWGGVSSPEATRYRKNRCFSLVISTSPGRHCSVDLTSTHLQALFLLFHPAGRLVALASSSKQALGL